MSVSLYQLYNFVLYAADTYNGHFASTFVLFVCSCTCNLLQFVCLCREIEKTNEEFGVDIPALLFGLELDKTLE
jgi:hypothetical protein